MSRALRVIVGLVLAWIGLGLDSAAVAAEAHPTSPLCVAYNYDHGASPKTRTDVITERGPPASYGHTTWHYSVNRSHGGSARTYRAASLARTAHDDRAELVNDSSGATVKGGDVHEVDGGLNSVARWQVAANSGRGLGELGGVISQTGRNGAGGRIFTSSRPINQNDFAGSSPAASYEATRFTS